MELTPFVGELLLEITKGLDSFPKYEVEVPPQLLAYLRKNMDMWIKIK